MEYYSGGKNIVAEETNIQFSCSQEFKRDVKIAIMEKGINSLQDGYLEIFQLGLEQFKKKREVSKR
jgi:hypothetical protein